MMVLNMLSQKNQKLTLFANVNDAEDICYRKTITENGEEYYTGLDDDKEFDLVSMTFAKKILEENR